MNEDYHRLLMGYTVACTIVYSILGDAVNNSSYNCIKQQSDIVRQRAVLLVNDDEINHETLEHKHMPQAKLVPKGVTSSPIVTKVGVLQDDGGYRMINK